VYPSLKLRRFSAWAALVAGFALIIAVCYLALNWPFTQAQVAKALQDRFARQVEIRGFHPTYFPPGCVVDGVSFLHRKRKDLPPLITVQSLRIRGSYAGLLRIHKSVPEIQLIGLQVNVPPKTRDGKGGAQTLMPLTNSTSGKQLGIDELAAENAVLEFLPGATGKQPFKLQIHRLRLERVGEDGSIPFHAALQNTEPPGEIVSDGKIGPWNEEDPGGTPVSGSYTYENVNLGVFEGIAGTLSSRGTFSGELARIDTEGQTDVPNLRFSSGGGHSVHLVSKYKAEVDASNGNTLLKDIQSTFRRTNVVVTGSVSGHPGHGKSPILQVHIPSGRVEDLLYLIDNDPTPSMTGAIGLHGKVELPPGPAGFLTRLRIDGNIGVVGGRFANPLVQTPVNRLSKSAQGETRKEEEVDPSTALSNLKGNITVRNGIATLSNVSFAASGTLAEIEGTYNLLNKAIDLRGILHTTGKLSDTTSGFKAFVLRGLSPFLKKKSVTVVHFTIKGTTADPVFALDLL
jgi:hypothetical protein